MTKIVLDLDLGLPIEELCEAWANDEHCRENGELIANPTPGSGVNSFEFDYSQIALAALVVTGLNLSKEMIMELIRRALKRSDERTNGTISSQVEVKVEDDPETGLPIFRVNKVDDD